MARDTIRSRLSAQEVGTRLREIRRKCGISLREVEEQSQIISARYEKRAYHVSQNALSAYERGASVPSIRKLSTLSEIYGLPYADLFHFYGIELSGSRLRRHLRLLGVLWIFLSVFRLLGVVVWAIIGNDLFRSIRMPPPVDDFLPTLMSLIGGFLLLSAAAGFAAGWGLLQRFPWARVLVLFIASFSLLDIPFGTALGVYTLWILLPPEADVEYTRMARHA